MQAMLFCRLRNAPLISHSIRAVRLRPPPRRQGVAKTETSANLGDEFEALRAEWGKLQEPPASSQPRPPPPPSAAKPIQTETFPDVQPLSYSASETDRMRRHLRARLALEHKNAVRDVDEVIRDRGALLRAQAQQSGTVAAKLRDIVLRSGADPLFARKKEEAAIRFRAETEAARRAGDMDAVLDHIAAMSDNEILLAAQGGALDALAMWEGEPELTSLPHEFFGAEGALAITKEIAARTIPQSASDDEAPAITMAETISAPGGVSHDPVDTARIARSVRLEEIAAVEAYERRSSGDYLSQPNAVLRMAAACDPEIRQSLDVLDRARRASLRDGEFQEAQKYAAMLEKQRLLESERRASFRKQSADSGNVPFFNESRSRPPPRAGSAI